MKNFPVQKNSIDNPIIIDDNEIQFLQSSIIKPITIKKEKNSSPSTKYDSFVSKTQPPSQSTTVINIEELSHSPNEKLKKPTKQIIPSTSNPLKCSSHSFAIKTNSPSNFSTSELNSKKMSSSNTHSKNNSSILAKKYEKDLDLTMTPNEIVSYKTEPTVSHTELNILSNVYIVKEDTPSTFNINGETLYFQKKNENLSQATERIFKKQSTYDSKKILRDLVESFAAYWEFCILTDGMKFTCNKAGLTSDRQLKGEYPKRIHKRTFKCECQWRINFCYIIKHEREGPVRISNLCSEHTFPCVPSMNQFQEARQVSGQLTHYTDLVLKDLVNFLSIYRYVDPLAIRSLLYRCYPSGQYITYTGINNARLRAQMIVDEARINNQDPTTLACSSKIQDLTKRLDFNVDNILDKAVQASDNIFRGVLNTCEGNNKLLNFLYQLSLHDNGFTYKIFFNVRNEISGFMWMTSTMRSNFERFGSFISLDAMKRSTNIHLWPYIAPVVLNEFNNVMVICESFVAGEQKDAYVAILQGLIEMAPGRSKDNVKAIYADEFLTTDTLIEAGFTKTKLIYDHVHLRKKFPFDFKPMYDEVRTILLKIKQ